VHEDVQDLCPEKAVADTARVFIMFLIIQDQNYETFVRLPTLFFTSCFLDARDHAQSQKRLTAPVMKTETQQKKSSDSLPSQT
jgi:hypothetical protein